MRLFTALIILGLAIVAGPVGAGLPIPVEVRALLALAGVALAILGGLSYRARH